MKKVIILGAGLVGQAMAIDLCHDYEVTSADWDPARLKQLSSQHPIRTIEADLSKPQTIRDIVVDYDLVIGALPGFLGFQALSSVIASGKNIVDISFFDEDPFELHELAKRHQVTAVIDCGVAPGIGNIILGYHAQKMQVERYECLTGGLPVVRSWPYEYKAPFSPIDVIEEYTRPARMVEHGALVIKPALSDAEYVEFDQIGTLEAFNTDGLRTLLRTMKIPYMREKTLRYPGHAHLMRVLRETGFFDKNPVSVNGVSIRPLDLTTRLLFPRWKLEEGEEEFTVVRITIEGTEAGQPKRYVYSLLDRYDQATRTTSMARTTGYTATAVGRLILEHQFSCPGICPPEYIGADERCFRQIMDYLATRRVVYTVQVHHLPSR